MNRLDAETWSDRYLLHKYWARKPGNVVRQHIAQYTQGLDDAVVLDPFCGSGVTAVEAVALGKKAVAVDLNPIACLITRVTAYSPVDLARLDELFHSIMVDVQAELSWLYATRCASCGAVAVIHSIGWVGDEPHEVRYHCSNCGARQRRAAVKPMGDEDRAVSERVGRSEIPYWYPDPPVFQGWQTLKLHRAGIRSFAGLYTRRNLWALAALWDRISQVEAATYREILQVTFTSVVAQATKMIADFKQNAGGPSWKINTYWLPRRWQELNVFRSFANRYQKMRKAKAETNRYVGERHGALQVFQMSSANLTPVESADPGQAAVAPESVDYVFTDPPYGGESIQYLELSALWNMWITGGELSFEGEVIFNPHRGRDQAYYDAMLARVFRQVYIALKPGRWLSVTFHNKDSAVWNSLLAACAAAGFVLETVVPLHPSAPNLTQKLTRGAPKTDLVLHFRKPLPGEARPVGFPWSADLPGLVRETAEAQILAEGFTTTGKVFDQVLIRWLTGAPSFGPTFTVFDVGEILACHFRAAGELVANPLVRERGDVHWVKP
ncbi:MAG TPA: DNA methyltransferase [Symbiobacteriaceae bacterium]|nr:DNA methyltransferase [Symbiobacteriaceae bacterium]